MSHPAWSNQLISTVIVSAPTGGYAGIFIYSPSPGPGNLIGSWAASAGTDPYGNAYPQGLNVKVGSITGSIFQGNNFFLSPQGFFIYSGTPALGNLVESIAPVAGTDPYGNVYKAGFATYQGSTPNQASVQVKSELDLYSDVTVQDGVNVRPSVLVANATYPGEMRAFSGQVNAADGQGYVQICSGACADPSRYFGSGSEVDIVATHFGIAASTFVASGKGIFGQDAGWVTVGMASGWSGRGAGYPPFQVFRSPLINGVMLVRGWISTSNSTANGTSIATLGAGYYNTSLNNWIPCSYWTGSAAVNASGLGLQLNTSGGCTLYGITTAGTIGVNFQGVVFLDNLS